MAFPIQCTLYRGYQSCGVPGLRGKAARIKVVTDAYAIMCLSLSDLDYRAPSSLKSKLALKTRMNEVLVLAWRSHQACSTSILAAMTEML